MERVSESAVVVIDMINTYEHADADPVAPVRPDDTSLSVVKARHSIFCGAPGSDPRGSTVARRVRLSPQGRTDRG